MNFLSLHIHLQLISFNALTFSYTNILGNYFRFFCRYLFNDSHSVYLLYFALEYFSHTKQIDLISFLKISGPMGPLAGTLLGLIPECGMSVFVTSLFLTRKVSIGTLIATYLATSDEALPVLIANGEQAIYIFYILGLKLLIGVTSGYLIDLLISKKFYEGKAPEVKSSHAVEIDVELHRTRYMEIIIHSLKRTFRIYFWVFVITIAISLIVLFYSLSRIN